MSDSARVVQLLGLIEAGDRVAQDTLLTLLMPQLLRIARCQVRKERRGHSLQAGDIVNEAYLRLLGNRSANPASFVSRAHFLGCAARAMRRVLVDYARARKAAKRGGTHVRVPIDDVIGSVAAPSRRCDVDVLDQALERLSVLDAAQAQVVELRYFAGMTIEETAAVLHCSPTTVKEEWRAARAWLGREMRSAKPSSVADPDDLG